MIDAILIAVAFLFGLLAQKVRLPPLVGFLAAGFVLQAMGREGGAALSAISDLGVTLLLFSIGLKLRVRTLAQPEIWGGTTLHAGIVIGLFAPVVLGAAALITLPGEGLNWGNAFLIAFALSFSSTVFAVKSLTENGDLGALHGRTAIGVLVMQDILAVAFLTASTGKLPSYWALAVIPALLLARPLFGWVLSRSGHGELLSLCGLFLALVIGAAGFETLKMKADLGALFIGVLVGSSPRASELRKSLNGITDILLVGFFLQIGLEGKISWQGLGWALFFLLLLPFKSALFFGLFTRFRLRARTSWMAAISLSTYSEFGLIVMALGVAQGWIESHWLVAIALTLSLSFLIAAPLNRRAEALYDPISDWLRKWERRGRHRGDLPILEQGERVAIFGMGRVGLATYHVLESRFPGQVIGFDRDPVAVEAHRAAERNVKLADATDSDFWERVCPRDALDLAVLAMPVHKANVRAIETLKRHDFHGVVAVAGKFDEEIRQLRSLGVDTSYNLYAKAGAGFAHHVVNVFTQQRPDLATAWGRDPDDH